MNKHTVNAGKTHTKSENESRTSPRLSLVKETVRVLRTRTGVKAGGCGGTNRTGITT